MAALEGAGTAPGQDKFDATLCDKLLGEARRFAPSLPEADREDAVQETLLRVYAARRRISGGHWTYAVRTLHNVIRTQYRSSARRDDAAWLGKVVTLRASVAPDTAEVVSQRHLAGAVRATLGALPTQQRVAVALVHLLDLTVPQAAAVMGTTVAAAKMHLQRGRAALREALSDLPGLIALPAGWVRRARGAVGQTVASPGIAMVAALCLGIVQTTTTPLPYVRPLGPETTTATAELGPLPVAPKLGHQPPLATRPKLAIPTGGEQLPPRRRKTLPTPLPTAPVEACLGDWYCFGDGGPSDEVCVNTVQEPIRPCAKPGVPVCDVLPATEAVSCTPAPQRTTASPAP